jgi:hypothetical protein
LKKLRKKVSMAANGILSEVMAGHRGPNGSARFIRAATLPQQVSKVLTQAFGSASGPRPA